MVANYEKDPHMPYRCSKVLRHIALALSTALPLAGVAQAENWTRITTADDFADFAVGPVWHFTKGQQELSSDGTLTGHVPGYGNFRGTWEWKDQMYCRKIDFYEAGKSGDDCLVIERDGTMMQITRDFGKSRTYTAEIKPKVE